MLYFKNFCYDLLNSDSNFIWYSNVFRGYKKILVTFFERKWVILESLSELNEHVGLLGFLKYAGSLTKLRRWLLIAVSDNADLKPPIINKLGWLEVW